LKIESGGTRIMYHRETTDTKYSPFISLPLIETREKIFVGWTIKNLNKINALLA
jgi:hypothetical protein